MRLFRRDVHNLESDECRKIYEQHQEKYLDVIRQDYTKIKTIPYQQLPNTFILQALQINIRVMTKLPDRYRRDRDVFLSFADYNIHYLGFRYMDQSLKTDRDFLIRLMYHSPKAFTFIDETLKTEKGFLLDLLCSRTNVFGELPPSIRTDRDFLIEASVRNPWVLEEETATLDLVFLLAEDTDFVMTILRRNPSAFRHISYENQKSEFVREAVRLQGCNIIHVMSDLREDPEVVLDALQEIYRRLQSVPQPVPRDRTERLMMEAMQSLDTAQGWFHRFLRTRGDPRILSLLETILATVPKK